jgi:indolepyruvate ferredoxin oxidoreductase beta subunit
MKDKTVDSQQLIISGVGGQGILFITRLLADAAIYRGLPVLSSETHGMAQRGGMVVSHLKVGRFTSPLVRSGSADGLMAMRGANFALHRSFLKPDGWGALNSSSPSEAETGRGIARSIDADLLARESGAPQTVNLILLGFILAEGSPFRFFCAAEDVVAIMRSKMSGKESMLKKSLQALETGLDHGRRLFG